MEKGLKACGSVGDGVGSESFERETAASFCGVRGFEPENVSSGVSRGSATGVRKSLQPVPPPA